MDHRRAEGVDHVRSLTPTGCTSCAGPSDASLRHKGLTMLLVPVTSPASRSGRSRTSPVPWNSASASSPARVPDADLVVGGVDDGWRVVMGTARDGARAALIPMQLAMEHEVLEVAARALDSGALQDPPHPTATRRRLHRHAAHESHQRGDVSPACRPVATTPMLRQRRASCSPRSPTSGSASSPWTSRVRPRRSCRARLPEGLSFAQRISCCPGPRPSTAALGDPAQHHLRAGARAAAGIMRGPS